MVKDDGLAVNLMYIPLKIEVFKEDDVFVAVSSELNVSSFGDTVEEARASLREAIDAFIEECQSMGTLDDVLEEAGFSRTNGTWEPRKPVLEEELSLSI
jgi:predicted RNase H-like HicB family nuclease